MIIATTEGALDEVAALLTDIQGLIVEAANEGAMSDEEIKANQLQIDSAIASIERIANSTSFAGRYLLNGTLDYVTSGVNDTDVVALAVNGAQFGSRPYIPVNVDVTASAQYALLHYGLRLAHELDHHRDPGQHGRHHALVWVRHDSLDDGRRHQRRQRLDGRKCLTESSPAGSYLLSQELGQPAVRVSVKALPGSGAFDVQRRRRQHQEP